ncbi:unnamed protein product [Adineta ricciae]|uniref:Uncharacterized protein n=1 Tax=Adineta ricciae TaxID=249248 RepID=A0A813Z504_ADIRI|nr:unnamed protein product [Adineta ricciae]
MQCTQNTADEKFQWLLNYMNKLLATSRYQYYDHKASVSSETIDIDRGKPLNQEQMSHISGENEEKLIESFRNNEPKQLFDNEKKLTTAEQHRVITNLSKIAFETRSKHISLTLTINFVGNCDETIANVSSNIMIDHLLRLDFAIYQYLQEKNDFIARLLIVLNQQLTESRVRRQFKKNSLEFNQQVALSERNLQVFLIKQVHCEQQALPRQENENSVSLLSTTPNLSRFFRQTYDRSASAYTSKKKAHRYHSSSMNMNNEKARTTFSRVDEKLDRTDLKKDFDNHVREPSEIYIKLFDCQAACKRLTEKYKQVKHYPSNRNKPFKLPICYRNFPSSFNASSKSHRAKKQVLNQYYSKSIMNKSTCREKYQTEISIDVRKKSCQHMLKDRRIDDEFVCFGIGAIDFIDNSEAPTLCLKQDGIKSDERICLYRRVTSKRELNYEKGDKQKSSEAFSHPSFERDSNLFTNQTLSIDYENNYYTNIDLEISLLSEMDVSTTYQWPSIAILMANLVPICPLTVINCRLLATAVQTPYLPSAIHMFDTSDLWRYRSLSTVILLKNDDYQQEHSPIQSVNTLFDRNFHSTNDQQIFDSDNEHSKDKQAIKRNLSSASEPVLDKLHTSFLESILFDDRTDLQETDLHSDYSPIATISDQDQLTSLDTILEGILLRIALFQISFDNHVSLQAQRSPQKILDHFDNEMPSPLLTEPLRSSLSIANIENSVDEFVPTTHVDIQDTEQHQSMTILTHVPLSVLHNHVSHEKIVSTAAAETQTSLFEPLDTSNRSLMENTDLQHINLKINHNLSLANSIISSEEKATLAHSLLHHSKYPPLMSASSIHRKPSSNNLNVSLVHYPKKSRLNIATSACQPSTKKSKMSRSIKKCPTSSNQHVRRPHKRYSSPDQMISAQSKALSNRRRNTTSTITGKKPVSKNQPPWVSVYTNTALQTKSFKRTTLTPEQCEMHCQIVPPCTKLEHFCCQPCRHLPPCSAVKATNLCRVYLT